MQRSIVKFAHGACRIINISRASAVSSSRSLVTPSIINPSYRYHTAAWTVGKSHRSPSLAALLAPSAMATRGLKNKAHTNPRPNKTKKAVLKRFILTGKGRLKYGHDGKSHLNRGKSKSRMRRLGKKGILSGTMAKNMKSLILTGK